MVRKNTGLCKYGFVEVCILFVRVLYFNQALLGRGEKIDSLILCSAAEQPLEMLGLWNQVGGWRCPPISGCDSQAVLIRSVCSGPGRLVGTWTSRGMGKVSAHLSGGCLTSRDYLFQSSLSRCRGRRNPCFGLPRVGESCLEEDTRLCRECFYAGMRWSLSKHWKIRIANSFGTWWLSYRAEFLAKKMSS